MPAQAPEESATDEKACQQDARSRKPEQPRPPAARGGRRSGGQVGGIVWRVVTCDLGVILDGIMGGQLLADGVADRFLRRLRDDRSARRTRFRFFATLQP